MGTVEISKTKKGQKVQIDGDPFLIAEWQFVKPGKGQAVYTLKLKNLLKNTVVERKFRSGDTVEEADVSETNVQFLYQQGDEFVFMDQSSYEQYEMNKDQLEGAWQFLKDNMECTMMLFNNNPISLSPPNHVVLKVEYAEPTARGNTATNVTKPVTVETGAEIQAPPFVEIGDLIKVDTRTGEYVERVKE